MRKSCWAFVEAGENCLPIRSICQGGEKIGNPPLLERLYRLDQRWHRQRRSSVEIVRKKKIYLLTETYIRSAGGLPFRGWGWATVRIGKKLFNSKLEYYWFLKRPQRRWGWEKWDKKSIVWQLLYCWWCFHPIWYDSIPKCVNPQKVN